MNGKRLVLFVLIFGLISGCSNQQQPPAEGKQKEEEVKQEEPQSNNEEKEKDENTTLSKQTAEQLNQSFREQLFQATDQNLKVKNFDDKDALIQHLTVIADKELAKEYVNLYYEEKNNGLYLIPKDDPVLLNKNIPYQLDKNDDGEYYVSQEHETELTGKYHFYMVFKQTQNQWIIEDIKLDVEEQHDNEENPDQKTPHEDTNENEGTNEETVYSSKQIEQHGNLLLVNKSNALPQEYQPESLVIPDVLYSFEEDLPKKQMRQEAATALEKMFQAAESEGITLYAVSGYRSYQHQQQVFQYNVNQHGEDYANQFSAKPGESEHQTGLTMDITSRSVSFGLVQQFGETTEGKWVAEHAHKYGFIVRYPEDKESITGYIYEPWHLRYIGNQAAKEIHEKNITLEEYLNAQ